VAYDLLHRPGRPDKAYLHLLLLAARESEATVDAALRQLIDQGRAVTVEAVEAFLQSGSGTAVEQKISLRMKKVLK